ncbi:MAG: Crp/Fnr family transcriptional regulator [Candidatus Solibacter usitatus]|nr:Crp/Fnr family transcriptional regulator [Candidatus Solibacter usitatus]
MTRIPQARRFTVLFSAGSVADSVFFLISGLVKISRKGPDEKEVLLRVVKPGEVFGDDAFLISAPRASSAEVLLEASVAIVPKELFERFCIQQPQVYRLLSHVLAQREQDLEFKIEMLLMRDVEQRILLCLADLAEALGGSEENGGYEVQLSQSEVANMIGATRETTSTTLNALERRGLLRLGRRRMIVDNPHLLREAAKPGETTQSAAE